MSLVTKSVLLLFLTIASFAGNKRRADIPAIVFKSNAKFETVLSVDFSSNQKATVRATIKAKEDCKSVEVKWLPTKNLKSNSKTEASYQKVKKGQLLTSEFELEVNGSGTHKIYLEASSEENGSKVGAVESLTLDFERRTSSNQSQTRIDRPEIKLLE